ncbi:MAG: hypothetical protein EOO42_01045 [Flavobacteriales bacterium]|nr:MAG: hypothetical protein EOO42_01045 [Flavobacteriales bacterium]
MKDFQKRVGKWLCACFGIEIAENINERSHRFLEESLELCQSLGTTKEEALILVDYVYNRDVGETQQEVGGVMVTLGALCYASKLEMDDCAFVELVRIEHPTVMEKIRIKQQNKPKSSPLPQ